MKYSFNGWDEDPLALFDAGRYGECLHATIQAYSVVNHPGITQAAVEDTGLLHELAHLASGVAISMHNSVDGLRVELVGVMLLGKDQPYLPMLALSVAVTGVLAALSWHFIEAPGLRLKSHLRHILPESRSIAAQSAS